MPLEKKKHKHALSVLARAETTLCLTILFGVYETIAEPRFVFNTFSKIFLFDRLLTRTEMKYYCFESE